MPLKDSVKSFLKLFIKIAVTVICLLYVSRKIDWGKSFQIITNSNLLWLFAAIILFTASKIVSSIRLNIYFDNINLKISQLQNLKLYWLGMFYNLFLPGGIGGDAYKVILLNRNYRYPVKKLSAAVLLDRISGVIGLIILAAIYFFLIASNKFSVLGLAAILPCVIVFYFLVKVLFPSFTKVFTPTL